MTREDVEFVLSGMTEQQREDMIDFAYSYFWPDPDEQPITEWQTLFGSYLYVLARVIREHGPKNLPALVALFHKPAPKDVFPLHWAACQAICEYQLSAKHFDDIRQYYSR